MSNYKQKLLDPRWQKKRLEILERDNFSCVLCNADQKTLHVHHFQYHPLTPNPWEYDDGNLITLCYACHAAEHDALYSSKANVLLALANKGFNNVTRLENLADYINSGVFDDAIQSANEKMRDM